MATDQPISQHEIDTLLEQAEAVLDSVDQPVTTGYPPGVKLFQLEEFSAASAAQEAASLQTSSGRDVDLKIELGRAHMVPEEVLKLNPGSVVPLDKLIGDLVDIYANGRMIARGEVLVLNDSFCVRVAELVARESAAA